jgi:hypothetical protein
VVVVDPIILEVMAGARRDVVARTQRLLEAQQLEALWPKLDWLDAATIYRELRWQGVTIRSQVDALIAGWPFVSIYPCSTTTATTDTSPATPRSGSSRRELGVTDCGLRTRAR